MVLWTSLRCVVVSNSAGAYAKLSKARAGDMANSFGLEY